MELFFIEVTGALKSHYLSIASQLLVSCQIGDYNILPPNETRYVSNFSFGFDFLDLYIKSGEFLTRLLICVIICTYATVFSLVVNYKRYIYLFAVLQDNHMKKQTTLKLPVFPDIALPMVFICSFWFYEIMKLKKCLCFSYVLVAIPGLLLTLLQRMTRSYQPQGGAWCCPGIITGLQTMEICCPGEYGSIGGQTLQDHNPAFPSPDSAVAPNLCQDSRPWPD